MGKVLCMVFMGVCMAAPVAVGQSHNGQVCYQLLETFFETKGDTFQAVNAEAYPGTLPPYVLDTAARRALILSEPEIFFQKIGKGTFERSLTVGLTLHDSVYRQERLSYADTLSLQQVRELRKASPPGMRGDPPAFGARFMRPVAVIIISVAGVVALFYIRSR